MSQVIAERGALVLTCAKCTRQEVFPADTRAEAVKKAVRKGWIHRDGKFICPKCPAYRP